MENDLRNSSRYKIKMTTSEKIKYFFIMLGALICLIYFVVIIGSVIMKIINSIL